jgi:hypothetical protein
MSVCGLTLVDNLHYCRVSTLHKPLNDTISSLLHHFRLQSTETPSILSQLSLSLSLSHVTTDGQSASLSWYKAPIRGLRPDIFSVRNTEYV